MAKFTKKIRIKEYEVLNNQFILTFRLSGYADQLAFGAEFNSKSTVLLEYEAEEALYGFGFLDADLDQIISELVDWLQKPRKNLDGLSHAHTMRSRFEVTERLEAERRGKAAAERIAMEAPCLDWAMSVTEELVDEPAIVAGADVQASSQTKALDDFLSADKRSEDAAKFIRAHFTKDFNSICDRDLKLGRDTVREVADATRDMLINPVQEMEELAASLTDGFISREQAAERMGVDLKCIARRGEADIDEMNAADRARADAPAGIFYSTFPGWMDVTPPDSEGSADTEAQHAVEATSNRISAMETAGLGEEPVHPLEEIAAFNKAVNVGSPSPTTETAATNAWVPLSARPYSGKSYLYDLVWNTRFHLTRAESLTRRRHHNKASEAFENLDAAFGKLCDYVDYFEKPQALPTAEIDKAVNAIHTQARRFVKPMTLREHDFLRDVIREEIEKVVGGVL
ncbi:hypothetical protein [Neorhizobium galegae]|uniref:Uncharacterized protein n=1 Tax=Neorhizobium galegae bv. orientalis str. HAMBI 540 TaxID=1028800 RepID=A0A068SL02_NEOGA|nr:hypothetical protein [Neorhizobium galegae]CDN46853.1 Hypothetical protein RG540_CH06630 [Neorhizobium galegae bv. orientalis str. HAMBI 540]